jgi:digeranylgeranylglycerophospholipid reductase
MRSSALPLDSQNDVMIAGAGPAGLSAAEAIARRGFSTVVLEQSHEIGSPIRTSGGSFIGELRALGLPDSLWHPISRVRFVAPNNAAIFDYPDPVMCVIDVRRVFQHLAERAIAAGAIIRLATPAVAPILEDGRVTGVRTRDASFHCRVLIDATGYRSTLVKQAGLDPGFGRFGVGAEYDMFAPHCDQSEAVLVVGDEAAPSGYAWVFPWGGHRVRVGVGIIHPDSSGKPDDFLDRFVENADHYGVNLKGAQPVEHHSGLIPAERFAKTFVGDGIIGVGDTAGQASSLLGEGIRWAIRAGRMAGETVAGALERGDTSRRALVEFEHDWRRECGMDHRIAYRINKRIAGWDGPKWDARVELLKTLSPAEFAEALQTKLTGKWVWRFAARELLRRARVDS